MKKVTLLFMLLCSIITYSQISLQDNFDSYGSNAQPTGWTGDFVVTSTSLATSPWRCGTRAYFAVYNAATTKTFTTPNLVAASNGADLNINFDYKIAGAGALGSVAPLANWGTFVFEYSTDGGTNWTLIDTKDDITYTYDGNCQAAAYTIAGSNLPIGSDFQFRGTLTLVNVSGNTGASIDNLVIQQAATEVPNCDVTLTSATSNVYIDTTITWSPATGIPTGYYVSVGTASGVYDILDNVDAGNTTSQSLTGLEYNTMYYVLISPYNAIGTASCAEFTFTTVGTVPPNCDAVLNAPLTDVSVETPTITWSGATGYPTGYKLAVGYTNVDYTFFASTDVGNVTSYQLPNLQYATTYYVKIIPYNAYGDADCTGVFGSFTTEDAPPAGEVCATAIAIDPSADFNAYIDLSPFADDYSSTPCSTVNNEIGGKEMVYSITPTVDSSINLSATNIATKQSSIHVLDGCPEASTSSCLAFGTSGSALNDVTLNDVVLLAGNTYYIVLASNSTSATNATFDFDITFNDCIVPLATFTTVPDCANGQYSVNVNVTYFGNGSSLTISDGVNANQVLTATGQVTFGPYNNATVSNLTITSDLGCAITKSLVYYCTPANDECSAALPFTLSADSSCGTTVSGYTYASSNSTEDTCLTSTYIDVWHTFTPTESAYYQFNLSLMAGATGTSRFAVYTGTCGTLALASPSCDNVSTTYAYLPAGQAAYIIVQTNASDAQGNIDPNIGANYTLCGYQLPEAVANNDCANAEVVAVSDSTGSNTISASTENAYYSAEGCNSATQGYEMMWYSFTPEYTGTYYATFSNTAGTAYHAIFNTSDCALVAESNNMLSSCNKSAGTDEIVLTAGQTILIQVKSISTASFTFFIYPDASLSTADVNFEGFRYYPNPVKNTLTFESPNMISSVAIYNVVGQKVLATAGNNTMSTVNMSGLPNGIYFAKVNIDGAEKTIKIIKE